MGLEHSFGDSALTTTIDSAINWCRKNSVWPMPLGISCCGIEMMAFANSPNSRSEYSIEGTHSPRLGV